MKKILSLFSAAAILVFTVASVIATGFAGIPSWPSKEYQSGYFFISENPYGTAVYQKRAHASIQFNGFTTRYIRRNIITLKPDDTKAKTIVYSRDDIIFDENGVLYTDPQIQQISVLEKLLGKSLTKYQDSARDVRFKTASLFITNPLVPGVLELRIPDNTTIRLDKDALTITVIGLTTNLETITYTSYTKLSAMDTPITGKNNL